MIEVSRVLPVILVALVLVSAVQAFQLNSLKEKLSEGKLSVSSGAKGAVSPVGATPSVANSGAGAASSIADLPSMVGGC